MSLLDRLFGGPHEGLGSGQSDDRMLGRYRHLLQSAPVESIEQAHTEAFGVLTESQRGEIYEELSRGAGTGERPLSSEPATLARSAVRAERRMPGSLVNSLQNADHRGGFDGALVAPVVERVTESALLSAFLPWRG